MKGKYQVEDYQSGSTIHFSQIRKLLRLTSAEWVDDEDGFKSLLKKGKMAWVWVDPYNAELYGKQILMWADSYDQVKEDYHDALMDI